MAEVALTLKIQTVCWHSTIQTTIWIFTHMKTSNPTQCSTQFKVIIHELWRYYRQKLCCEVEAHIFQQLHNTTVISDYSKCAQLSLSHPAVSINFTSDSLHAECQPDSGLLLIHFRCN